MFMDKGGKTTKSKATNEVKVVIASLNIVNVNVTTQSKTSEK
jgi:hypothetical protein